MGIIEWYGNIVSGIYNALNVTIPGFHVSIANIFLVIFILSCVGLVLRIKSK